MEDEEVQVVDVKCKFFDADKLDVLLMEVAKWIVANKQARVWDMTTLYIPDNAEHYERWEAALYFRNIND